MGTNYLGPAHRGASSFAQSLRLIKQDQFSRHSSSNLLPPHRLPHLHRTASSNRFSLLRATSEPQLLHNPRGWAWVRIFDFLTEQKLVGQKLSRKLVHITSGLLFALCWPFYSAFPSAQYFAALVPVSNGIRLLVYGLGLLQDEGLVKSVSREGDPRELLRGPLYYVVVLVFSTILFWRDSPVGVMALAMMCGGDGIADIVGRKLGASKLPYNPGKSWAGSIAMFLFGFLVSYGCLWYFALMGFYELDTRGTLLRLAVVSLAATIVESLPISTKLDDNVTVPLTTVVVGMLLFPPGANVFGLPSLI